MRQNGTLVLVDPAEEIEAQRRQIKAKMLLQAQQRLPAQVGDSLRRIVRPSDTNRTRDPPVTWSNVFEDEPPPEELTNPFAQGDHSSPVHPDPNHPEGDDE